MEPPKIWREKRGKYLAMGVECSDCMTKHFPFTESCTKCASKNVKEYKLATTGKVLYFSTVTQTTDEMMGYTPYLIAIIELADGIKITGQIVGCYPYEAKEGMNVRMVFRVLARNGSEGLIRYGYKFAPI
jgi:uncharacterized OB-fold protein